MAIYLTVREAARQRTPLDGSDAQALEGAFAQAERELAGAKAALASRDAEIAKIQSLIGRQERRIARAQLQESGVPVTPEWLGDVERLYPKALITQRVAAALRRAWAEIAALKGAGN